MKINKQIAESLASKVAAQIQKANDKRFAKIETELRNTKEFKKLTALNQQITDLKLKEQQLCNEFETIKSSFYEIANTKRDENTNISCSCYYSNKALSIDIGMPVSYSDIANDIMIEAAFAESGISADEFIEKITKKYIV